MKKRLLSMLLALSVLCGSMPVYALEDSGITPVQGQGSFEIATTETAARQQIPAEEPDSADSAQQENTYSGEVQADLSDVDMPDNDELFEAHLQQLLYGGYGVAPLANWGENAGVLNEGEKKVYDVLKAFAQRAANGDEVDSYEIPINVQLSWTFEELGVSGWEDEKLGQAIQTKLPQDLDTNKILNALLVDCPADLYWFDKTFDVGDVHALSIRYSTGESPAGDGVLINVSKISMVVAADYRKAGGSVYDLDAEKIKSAQKAIQNAGTIISDNLGKSDYERIVAYREAICDRTSYNVSAAGGGALYGDPWQLVYVFDDDPETKVVCEGYSKAFQYLCDMSGIDCYTVTGNMSSNGSSGPHMWNIVPMDGANYLVDVTNCDSDTIGYPDQLFMAGASGSVNQGYTATLTSPYSGTILYEYDEETIQLYDEDILRLASSKYVPPEPELTITGLPETVTYGDTFTLQALHADGTVTWSSTGAVQVEESTGKVTVNGTGAFTITATAGEQEDAVTGTAAARSLTVKSASAKNKTYDNSNVVTVTAVELEGVLNQDDVRVDLSKVTGTVELADAGTYREVSLEQLELTGTKAACYTLPATAKVAATVIISKATPTAPDVTLSAQYGQRLSNIELPEGWSWENPDTLLNQVGKQTYLAVFAENANYEKGKTEFSVTVTSRSIEPTVTLADQSLVFNGQEQRPAVTVVWDGTPLEENTDYTVTYSNNTNAGQASVTVTAIAESGYEFAPVTKEFTIAKATATSPAVVTQQYRYAQTGTWNIAPSYSMPGNAGNVQYQAGTKTDANEIITDWSVDENGNVSVTLSGKGAAGNTATLTVRISSQNYEDVMQTIQVVLTALENPNASAQPYEQPYDGDPVQPEDIQKQAAVDGTWSWKNKAPVDVKDTGTHTLIFTPTDSQTYSTVEVPVQVTITKVMATVTAEPQLAENLTYNGQPQNLVAAEGTADGGEMQYATKENGRYQLALPTATDAGTYEVWYVVIGDENHNSSNTTQVGTVTIAKADPNPELPKGLTATYGDTLADVKLPEGWTWDNPAQSVGDAGSNTFAATYGGDKNYNDYPANLTVEVLPASLENAQVSVDETNFTYNGAEQKPTVAGVVLNGKPLTENDYTVSADNSIHAGSYQLTVTGKGNYTGTVPTTYTIAKKPVTATVQAQDKTYDGTTQAEVTAQVTDVVGTDAITISGLCGTFAQKDVGQNLTVTVDTDGAQIAGNSDYDLTIPETTTASITPAPYSYGGVADQQVKIGNGIGTVNAAAAATGVAGEEVTGTLTWFEDEGHNNALDASYCFSGAENDTVVLYWTFTPDEGQTNYESGAQSGQTLFTLVNKQTPAVTAKGLTKTYDGKAVTLADLQPQADQQGEWAFAADTPELKNAGTYTVTLVFTPADTESYAPATTSVTVQIDRREATVALQLNPGNRVAVGDTLPTAGIVYEGILDGESLQTNIQPVITGIPGDTRTAGTYEVQWENAGAMLNGIEALEAGKNYAVTLKVRQVSLTVVGNELEVLETPEVSGGAPETEYRLEQTQLVGVPAELAGKYDSVDEVRDTMYQQAVKQLPGAEAENTVVCDVELFYSNDGGHTWQLVTEDDFPAAGVPVQLLYPGETNGPGYDFAVTHMITTGAQAGTVESLPVTETEKGPRVVVHSLSPMAITWKATPAVSGGTGTAAPSATAPTATPAPATSSGNTPYYTCPACGYHNWTATEEGYRCDHCGYLESVKQLSGYGNVKGVYEPKSSSQAAQTASTIAQTGDESNPLLWAVLMFASALTLGALAVYRRKRSR